MEKETDTIKKQIITEEEGVKIMRKCPRFQFCNAPKCPLDYFKDKRTPCIIFVWPYVATIWTFDLHSVYVN